MPAALVREDREFLRGHRTINGLTRFRSATGDRKHAGRINHQPIFGIGGGRADSVA